MRNNFFQKKPARISDRKRQNRFAAGVAVWGAITLAGTLLSPRPVDASVELDRRYSLTQVGILQAWDNVDGLFSEMVAQAYRTGLKDDSRFVIHELKKANELLSASRIPYHKLIDDPEVLSQLVKVYKLDSILRTKVYKEGPLYRFVIDWVHGPDLDVLASESFQMEEPFAGEGGTSGGDQFRAAIAQALDRVLRKIPFLGMVTGRDQKSVTVNLGSSSGLKKGDTLVLGTLEEVKKHPLLKQIVEWRTSATGRVIVDDVEDAMSFARIEAEEYGRQIGRYQKVLQVIPRMAPDPVDVKTVETGLEERKAQVEGPPRLGWIAPGLAFGNFSREASTSSNPGFSGNALSLGLKLDGQLWLNSNWFSDLNFYYLTGNYSAESIATNQPTGSADVNASVRQFRIGVGYHYHFSENFFGPRVWGKLGYQKTTFTLPALQSELRSTGVVSGLVLGVGGDLPIRRDYGALISLDVGLFAGGEEESAFLGNDEGASSVDFLLAGYVWLQPKMKLRVGLDFKGHNLDFKNGGNLEHRVVSFGPSLQIYF